MRAGLYIHIPFCQKKCAYCDFYSVTAARRLDDFMAAVQREMDFYRYWWPGQYDTLYLGGGTPSLLTVEQLAALLGKAEKIFSFLPQAEWTIESNPDDVTLSLLRHFRDLGFNRLSLGLQSLRDENLTWLGRRHTAAQGRQAIENAARAGFTNLGVDLIYGLPGSSLRLWREELRQVLEYGPAHLSCYQLSWEPRTRLTQQWRRGLVQPLDEEEEACYFLETSQELEAAGYLHYEVSNFCRNEQLASRHNQKYWQHFPYLGLGPSAHSFSRSRRHWNHRSLSLYCHDLHQGVAPLAGGESLGLQELRLETLYFGFRTRQGIHLTDFHQRYGQDLLTDPPGLADRLIREKKLEVRGDRLCPTPRGLAVADSLVILW